MSLTNFKTLAYNILKNLEDVTVRDIEIPDLEPCSECNNEIFALPLKPFTTLSCGHFYHRICIEKKILPDMQNVCPYPECGKFIDTGDDNSHNTKQGYESSQSSTSSIVRGLSNQLQIINSPIIHQEIGGDANKGVETQPDASSRKRSKEATDGSSNKKSKKHIHPEDSNILKKLIRELSSDTTQISEIKERKGLHRESLQGDELRSSERKASDGVRTFFDLYYKITKAEEWNENAHHVLISSYYCFGEELEKRLAHFRETNEEHEALKKLYDEVKDQLPKEVTRNALRKKADRARKVYDLFFRIGDDKSLRALYIQRIKTFSATSIAKLSEDEVKYVASKVREGFQA